MLDQRQIKDFTGSLDRLKFHHGLNTSLAKDNNAQNIAMWTGDLINHILPRKVHKYRSLQVEHR